MEKINYRTTSDSSSYKLTEHEGPLDPNLIVDCLYANVPQELRVKRRKEQQELIDKVNEIKNIVDKDVPEDLIKIVAGVCNHSNNGYYCCARISKAVIDAGYVDKKVFLEDIYNRLAKYVVEEFPEAEGKEIVFWPDIKAVLKELSEE